MTTEQLIGAGAQQDVQLSVTKLARWVRAGLIPPSLRKRHGRGRGKGAEWVWEQECLPRAVIIARALAAGDPSLQRAAQMLARAGYAPGVERLRRVLLDGIDVYERLATHREPYLKQQDLPVYERRRRLGRNIKRKGADLPDDVVDIVTRFTQLVHGLGNPNDADNDSGTASNNGITSHGLGQHLSLSTLREAISVVGDTDLLDAYELAGQALQRRLAPFIMIANAFALPFMTDRLIQQGKFVRGTVRSFDLEAILADVKLEDGYVRCSPDNLAGLLRLYFTAMFVLTGVEGEGVIEELATPIIEFGNIMTNFARQRGFPGADALSIVPEGGVSNIEASK